MSASGNLTKQAIDLTHCDGLEYQERVFACLVDRVFDDPRVLEIRNHERGEVDYVVLERPGKGMLASRRVHYFECKNYKRSLELDSVAKIMVVAVSDQPMSVHVVSRTPLQPQIRKYATRLFSFDGSTNGLFRGVEFHHWQTNVVLGCEEEDTEHEVSNVTGPGFVTPEMHEIHWWLSECAAFSEVQIASSESHQQSLYVRHGTLLTLILESADDDLVQISLSGLPDNGWSYAVLEGGDKGHYFIDTSQLASGEDYRVSLRVVEQQIERIVPIVHLHVSGTADFLPELRTEEIDDLNGKMGPSGDVRLVLVEGEAGVGKTHLIEKVAEGLRAKAGFDILRVTVPEDPDDELMTSIIRNCLTPSIEKGAFKELIEKIEAVLLLKESGGNLKTDFRLLVRAASRMGPRMIVLRDCHLVTPKLADEIWMLISALDDSSWGGIRLALEFRQPDANANTALQGLLRKIRLNIRKVLLERSVAPLGRDEFYRLSKRAFVHITDELITCLLNRTGGFPLFLDSYLRRLQSLGLITRGANSLNFEISEPARILADSLPEERQLILEERVSADLAKAFPEDWTHRLISLGLIAMADNAIGQTMIRNALGMPDAELRSLHSVLKDAGIGSVLPDSQIVFRHDLLRKAVAVVAVASETFAHRARQVAKVLLAQSVPSDEVKVCAIRVKIFALLKDDVSCELELRNGLKAAHKAHDYRHIVSFLNALLPLLQDRPNVHERLQLMKELAWANWVSDSLLVARDRYIQLATEAERNPDGDFSLSEAIATDAYRRAIGLDLELMEPHAFLENTISVLKRRQDHVTFNSILNRLVLFCARFGLPEYGYRLADLTANYIGDGQRENEGSVLCSELGMLYAASSPRTALDLYHRAYAMADGEPERLGTALAIHVVECMYLGKALDLGNFDFLWKKCQEHHLAEPLARASLLRGSLLLREGNLTSAAHWIERTATMVQLYHMKQFELAILNDQVLHALMSNEDAIAANIFAKFLLEFERVEAQAVRALLLIEETFNTATKAASTLHSEPTTIKRPSTPPVFCDPAAEIRRNIAVFSLLLGVDDVAQRYAEELLAHPCPEVSGHRFVEVRGTKLVLGAY